MQDTLDDIMEPESKKGAKGFARSAKGEGFSRTQNCETIAEGEGPSQTRSQVDEKKRHRQTSAEGDGVIPNPKAGLKKKQNISKVPCQTRRVTASR